MARLATPCQIEGLRGIPGAALLAAALCIAPSTPASAQFVIAAHSVQALTLCDTDGVYAAGGATAPAAIAKALSGPGALLVFRTCRDDDGNNHTFVREPRPHRGGVCRVFEQEIFAGKERDSVWIDIPGNDPAPDHSFVLHGWKIKAPAAWTAKGYVPVENGLAVVDDGTCPRSDDARYLAVVNTTDGMLKTFDALWRRVTSSPDSFDVAMAAVPLRYERSIDKNDPPANRRMLMRNAIFGAHERVYAIDCPRVDDLRGEGDCTARLDSFSVAFDVTEHGLALTGAWINKLI